MSYNLGRIGPYLSDRVVIIPKENGVYSSRIANSCWDWVLRIISWIYAPESYTDENRRTIQCFRQMISPIGEERLKRIVNRYQIDFAEMETRGSPLLSRTVAQISVGIQDVRIEDMEETIGFAKTNPSHLPPFFPEDLCHTLRAVSCAEELSAEDFTKLYDILAHPAKSFPLPEIGEINGSCPTSCFAWLFFDQFLADRERLALQQENPTDNFEVFAHNFSVRIMRREMRVGTLVMAPNSAEGKRQFYRVAACLFTGEGHVSYCLVPATKDTDLKPIRFYRGTSTTPAEMDAVSSFITDLEPQIGRTAGESAERYAPVLRAWLPPIEIVAGHSLGSTLAQMETVTNPHIRKVYVSSGPGLREEEIAKFNERMESEESHPLEIYVIDASDDDLSAMGHIHLGFQAPKKVKIYYRHYSALKNMGRMGIHTTIWDKQQFCGLEGGHSRAELDAYLDHRKKFSFEWIRGAVGPYCVTAFRIIRDIFRWLFGSRTFDRLGLELGVYRGKEWIVRHVKPDRVAHAMEEAFSGLRPVHLTP